MWKKWSEEQPEPGQKVIIPYGDGSGAQMGLVVAYDDKGGIDVLCAEDAEPMMRDLAGEIADDYSGRIWAALPDDYPIYWMP